MQLYKKYVIGGRKFIIYQEYDEELKESYPVYPDFEEHPEYTDEGRPFATAEQDGCPHCKPKTQGNPTHGDCGGCDWFHREETPYDVVGVCMCDARKLTL